MSLYEEDKIINEALANAFTLGGLRLVCQSTSKSEEEEE